MANDRRYLRARELVLPARRSLIRRRPPAEAKPASLDWPAWMALFERHRRQIARDNSAPTIGVSFAVEATCSSFKLEGIQCTEQEVIDAVTPNAAQRKFRSRTAQRIRNHVAILHSIDYALRLSMPLKTAAVLRWYTSVACGLSTSSLVADKMIRLDQIVGRINSPQLRLQPAIQEIARTHAELLDDPLFPSFNGILARLLLRHHLGRCGLPAVVFDRLEVDINAPMPDVGVLALLNEIEQSYQAILRAYGDA